MINLHGSQTVFRNLSLLVSLVCGLLYIAQTDADGSSGPAEMLSSMTDRVLLEIRNNPTLLDDEVQTRRLAEELILPNIDFRVASKWVLGKYWRRATDEQKTNFTREFSTFLTNNYTTAMVEFTDEIVRNSKNLKYMPLRGADNKYADVRMEVVLPNRTPVQVTYSMLNTKEGWKVYDISIEGISLATTYRSQFASQIRRNGLNNLIQTLADRNIARAEKTAANNEQ